MSDWVESRVEALEEDTLGYLIESGRIKDFVYYMDEKEERLVQRLLQDWLKTDRGALWYENQLQAMIEDVPEIEREDLPGCNR